MMCKHVGKAVQKLDLQTTQSQDNTLYLEIRKLAVICECSYRLTAGCNNNIVKISKLIDFITRTKHFILSKNFDS